MYQSINCQRCQFFQNIPNLPVYNRFTHVHLLGIYGHYTMVPMNVGIEMVIYDFSSSHIWESNQRVVGVLRRLSRHRWASMDFGSALQH